MPQKLPDYTYVPGVTPHPISDPRGHWRKRESEPQTLAQLLEWGLTLFQNGYYWEAHEIWEAAWVQLGRGGPQADIVKGFIKLAACGVKCLEGNVAGAIRHARRAQELLGSGTDSLELSTLPVREAMNLAGQCVLSAPIADDKLRVQAKVGGVRLLNLDEPKKNDRR